MTILISPHHAWSRLMALASLFFFTLVVSACGGNGAGAGGEASQKAASNASSLSLITSENSLGSDGKKSTVLTAIVKNDLNVAMKGQPILFSTTDKGATLQNVTIVTDGNGSATATLSITDRSVRNITVVAKSGEVTSSVVIPVAGTVLQISGSSTIVFNSQTEFSLSLRDSGGNPVANVPVSLTSQAGNRIEPPLVTTDAQGQAKFNVVGTKSGSDVIEASAQGVKSTFAAAVSPKQLTFTAPTAASSSSTVDILVKQEHNVSVRLVEDGVAQQGQLIRFASTRGKLLRLDQSINSEGGVVDVLTDGNGVATAKIYSTSSGISTLTATAPGGTTANRQIEFVSRSPASIKMQSSPPVVGANISVGGTNASQLIAKVRDLDGNPVKSIRVNFSAKNDPSNGKIEPSFALTDSLGVATASFVAGSNPTGFEGVQIEGWVNEAPSIKDTASLTVSELELSVRIGTGQLIEEIGPTLYSMPWIAIVADSAQNPVANANVTVALDSLRFRKAAWRYNTDAASWIMVDGETGLPPVGQPIQVCLSEDTNQDRRLTPGEDRDGDGELDPGSPATITVVEEGSRTNADGLAAIKIVYPKSYGQFVEVQMVVTITTVDGTESSARNTFWLPMLANDVRDPAVPPPGVNGQGPFGSYQDCADRR